MIGSISSSSSMMTMPSASSNRQSSQLSDTQKETISSVLSQYDSDSLSASDASDIVSSFKDAGITPTKELAQELDALGFDAQEIGDLAGAKPQGGMPPPPPPPPSDEEENSLSELLQSLLETEDEENEDIENTQSFEELMDYTSKILSLNDSSKTEILSLLEKYSGEENPYSKEQTSNLIKNSLKETLNDSNNYKHVSFYA